MHKNKMCHTNQREVGQDTKSFARALRSVLRQDPNVVLIGEMRDLETIESALTISETGHLTFATLHTSDAVQTINRIVDVFPAHQQQQIKTQLSFTLQAVICQDLIDAVDGGLALATEFLITNSAVKALVRESKTHQLYSVIQTGQSQGMMTMNQSLAKLVMSGRVTQETAMARSTAPDELANLLQVQLV
jgi:twitching motility protein PilT